MIKKSLNTLCDKINASSKFDTIYNPASDIETAISYELIAVSILSNPGVKK